MKIGRKSRDNKFGVHVIHIEIRSYFFLNLSTDLYRKDFPLLLRIKFAMCVCYMCRCLLNKFRKLKFELSRYENSSFVGDFTMCVIPKYIWTA